MSGFLKRWADRKSGAAEPEARPPAEPEAVLAPAEQAAPQPAAPDAEAIAAELAALPDLEDIGPATDIRPFLKDFVPAALRKAAMRRAWAADPIISTHLDVARDYAWEFNSGPLPVGFSNGLGADAVQRSLDALGEIGAEPLQTAAEGEGAGAAQPATGPEPEPESTQERAAPAARDATELPAESEAVAWNSPEIPGVDENPPPSSLLLQSRHGSALPS